MPRAFDHKERKTFQKSVGGQMSDSIIAVVPKTANLDSIQNSLSPQGLNVRFSRSFEDALGLIASGSARIFLCSSEDEKSWKEPILRMLACGLADRIVLLSQLADNAPA
jgi:hypothetical protein